jgi:transcriptional regulator with XRE-family HTH domain
LPPFDPHDDDLDEAVPPDSLGARLRAERERRNISIASIAESTKILGALLEGMEQDDVSRWPTGLYRRAFIRAYSQAIGLDPEPVVREFIERFPDPEDVPAPPQAAVAPAAPAVRTGRGLRLTLADHRWSFAPLDLIDEIRRRVSAVALDAFVLGVVSLTLFLVLGSFWAPLAVTAVVYYVGSILVLGNTPGIFVFGPRSRNNANLTLWSQGAERLAGRIREIFHLPERKEPIERTTP